MSATKGTLYMVYSCDDADCRRAARISFEKKNGDERTEGECKLIALDHGWYFGKWTMRCPVHKPVGGEAQPFEYGQKETKFDTKREK